MSQCERRSQAHTCWRAIHEHPGLLTRKVGHVWYEVWSHQNGRAAETMFFDFQATEIQLFRICVQEHL